MGKVGASLDLNKSNGERSKFGGTKLRSVQTLELEREESVDRSGPREASDKRFFIRQQYHQPQGFQRKLPTGPLQSTSPEDIMTSQKYNIEEGSKISNIAEQTLTEPVEIFTPDVFARTNENSPDATGGYSTKYISNFGDKTFSLSQ